MNSRNVVVAFACLGLLYAAPPLLAEIESPEICCSVAGECPNGMRCVADSLCDPESPGYCVPIAAGGGEDQPIR